MELTASEIAIINVIGIIIGSLISGSISYSRAKKSAYINSVSVARREWLESVRAAFLEANMYRNSSDNERHIQKINLLLNPSEKYVQLLTELQWALMYRLSQRDSKFMDRIIDSEVLLSKTRKEKIKKLYGDANGDEDLIQKIELVQQIILKREWNIIKKEIKLGRELKNEKEEVKQTESAVKAIDEEDKIRNTLRDLEDLAQRVKLEEQLSSSST